MAVFTAITATLTAVGTWFAGLGVVAQFAVRIGFGLALNGVASAIRRKNQPQSKKVGVSGQLQQGADQPRSFILGVGSTAGSLVYHNTWDTANSSKNTYYTRVTAVCDLPVEGLREVWINGQLCIIDMENERPNLGYPILNFRTNSSGDIVDTSGANSNGSLGTPSSSDRDHCWIKFYDGTQTAADAMLVNNASSAERPWSPENVGVGVAYVILTCRENTQIWQGLPRAKYVVEGIPLNDAAGIRDATMDSIPATQALTLLKGISYAGEWFYGVQNAHEARFDVSDWAEQAAKCKLPVSGADTMTDAQKIEAFGSVEVPYQYRCGGEISVDIELGSALEAILSSCNGRLVDTGWKYRLLIGEPEAHSASITDADILSDQEQTFTPFFGLSDTTNGVTATYPEPSEEWQSQSAPPLYVAQYEAEDGNRRLVESADMVMVPYKEQVQRVMKAVLAEARRARRHTISLPPAYWALEAGDTILWSSVRNGYEGKLFRVDGIYDLPTADIVCDLTEVDPADYTWSAVTDYQPVEGGTVTPQPIGAEAFGGFSAQPYEIVDDNGTGRKPAILCSWDGDRDGIRGVVIQVKEKVSGRLVVSGQVSPYEQLGAVVSEGVVKNVQYQARAIYDPYISRPVQSSSWVDVTAPNIGTSMDDLDQDVLNRFLEAETVNTDALNEAVQDAEDAAEDAATEALAAEEARTLSEVYAGAAESAAAGNMVVGGFEDGVNAFWRQTGPKQLAAVVDAESGHPLGRLKALLSDDTNLSFSSSGDDLVPFDGIMKDRIIRITGYVHNKGTDPNSINIARVGYRLYDAAGSFSGFQQINVATVVGQWEPFSIDVTTSNTNHVSHEMWLRSIGGTLGDLSWTDLRFEDITESAAAGASALIAEGHATTATDEAASAVAAKVLAVEAKYDATQEAATATNERIDATAARIGAEEAEASSLSILETTAKVSQGTGELLVSPFLEAGSFTTAGNGPTDQIVNEVYEVGQTIEFDVAENSTRGLFWRSQFAAHWSRSFGATPNDDFQLYTISLEFDWVSGASLDGAGFITRWWDDTNAYAQVFTNLADCIEVSPSELVAGKRYTATITVERPASQDNAVFLRNDVMFYANVAAFGLGRPAKHLRLHKAGLKAATPLEAAVKVSQTAIATLESQMGVYNVVVTAGDATAGFGVSLVNGLGQEPSGTFWLNNLSLKTSGYAEDASGIPTAGMFWDNENDVLKARGAIFGEALVAEAVTKVFEFSVSATIPSIPNDSGDLSDYLVVTAADLGLGPFNSGLVAPDGYRYELDLQARVVGSEVGINVGDYIGQVDFGVLRNKQIPSQPYTIWSDDTYRSSAPVVAKTGYKNHVSFRDPKFTLPSGPYAGSSYPLGFAAANRTDRDLEVTLYVAITRIKV